MSSLSKVVKVQKEIGGRVLSFEMGKWAKQANSAVVVTYGETVVLATVLVGPAGSDIDFFPLYVDYREAQYAAGKIPGGFFKREGRPSTKEILTMRMIDRPIRPLFPYDYRCEVQIQCMVLSSDNENDPDLIAMIGASAALAASSAPFQGPIGACRVGYIDGQYVVNPTFSQLAQSEMELLVAGPKEAINMIEFTGREMPEDVVAGATDLGHKIDCDIIALTEEFVSQLGVCKEYEPTVMPEELKKIAAERCSAAIREKKLIPGKQERNEALDEVRQALIDELIPEGAAPETLPYTEAQIKEVFYKLEGRIQRELILEGKRPDGRGYEDIRPLYTEVNVLPRTHGSAIFQRGETQALVTATLGTPRDQPIIDGLQDEYKKPFFMHYNFPPFSVGEIRPLRGPGRREIGHGALAEKSLEPIMPSNEVFPYTVRLVADILESNGSTSQAATCGGTLALLAAGVPIKAPVAGISIGMVSDDEAGKYVLLTDIVGEEDFHGDMDFKVAGTNKGITGIQLDMKARGIKQDRIVATFAQARRARLRILEAMAATISEPAPMSDYAPRMLTVKIDPEKIGKVIGPGGKMINKIQDETGATIDIEEDGTIFIASSGEGAEQAKAMIQAITENPEIGKIYKGRVVGIREFGAFVEILPGQEGLCHVSEMSDEYVADPNDFCKLGDEMEVRIIGIDDTGKIKVSRKAALNPDWTIDDVKPAPSRRGSDRGSRNGGERRGGGSHRNGGDRNRRDRE
ncbi:MAG TPA: polyribonucleotide nucleotidyltransferase [Phycisphaerae bacterium]|nr:polyribonucleotide nucleotidyltransferase [Phycisphaerae bacterium]HPS51927.1 polyribonucleotide nucleotidyltransferase [Phycisphaerae bacterium]